MTYFAYIETEAHSVTHMEPLTADDLDEAKLEAEALLDQHASGCAVSIIDDGEVVATVMRAGTPSSKSKHHLFSQDHRRHSL